MYDLIRGDTFHMMLYAVATAMALMACCYLLFRQGNAFALNITSPVRLRRWTAAFFACIALCHFWYLPMYFLTSSDDMMLGNMIAGLLDCMTVIPLTIAVLLVMLQDRRRPLWPVAVMVAPLVAGTVYSIAIGSNDLQPMLLVYFLLMWLGLAIYMTRAIRQYGRWLRDNYADLKNKEVWQCFVVLGIMLLTYAVYLLDTGDIIYEYAMEVIIMVLICYLLWRVETLSDLSLFVDDAEAETGTIEKGEDQALPTSIRKNIGLLLEKYCEEPQLYLQYDISLPQLAKAIGTNRLYLSRHFSNQGMTYNAYINSLRIQHFIKLYHEAVATHQFVSARQLALQSGFRSYSTFYTAFKQSKGMTATEWMSSES